MEDIGAAGDRWHAVESAFHDLTDTNTPIGGCSDFEFQQASGRLMLKANLNPTEDGSNLALICRLIASVTPLEKVGARALVLLEHYSNLRGLIRAATRDIQQDEILTATERSILRTVLDVSKNFLRECSTPHRQIRSFSDLHDYLKVSLATEQAEVTRLIMLDRHYNIIADEPHSFGKLNQTQLFPKEVVARTVAHDASAVIIVHSHPFGEPEPTTADIKLTKRLAFVLEELGVVLYDHVVVGRRVVVSFRRLGILAEEG